MKKKPSTSWLYRHIMRTELVRWRKRGWRLVCNGRPRLGGWDSVIIFKKVRPK